MLIWPCEHIVAQASLPRLRRLLVPRLRVHPEPWLMPIGWEHLNHSGNEPLHGASRRIGRRDIERLAGESGDEQVLPRRAEPVLGGYSSSFSHVTAQNASFHAVTLAHAARRSEALQDLTWHATRLPAAGACLGEWAKIELIVGAAQGGCVLQLGRAVSCSCAVLRRCGPCSCRPCVCVAA